MDQTGSAFKNYKVDPTPDQLATLLGDDVAVSSGRSVAQYTVMGTEYEFENRWTATLVKENGKWLLVGYHVSLNAFDNPIIDIAKRGLYWAGGIGLLVGLLGGFVVGRKRTATV